MKTELNYRNYKIRIEQDDDTQLPDEWGNEDCFLVYDHRNFYVKKDGFDPEDIYETMKEGKKLYDGYFYFPVYAYIHSGVSLQLRRWFNGLPQGHNEFDVSFRGFCLIKKQKGSYTTKKAFEIAESIVDEWNDYLTGNVYGFITEDSEGNEIDSCWGFYGDPEKSGLIESAENSIDCEIKNRIKTKIQKVKTFIRNNVPLEKRMELILV